MFRKCSGTPPFVSIVKSWHAVDSREQKGSSTVGMSNIDAMSVKELKKMIADAGLSSVGLAEKSELRERAREARARLEEARVRFDGRSTPSSKQKANEENASRSSPPSSKRKASPSDTTTKKKVKLADTPHAIIWVNAHGPGQTSGSWSQKKLKIYGVYSTKAKAEEAKAEIMKQYDVCGHGDITVGDTWEDEISLVIRPAECHFD